MAVQRILLSFMSLSLLEGTVLRFESKRSTDDRTNPILLEAVKVQSPPPRFQFCD
jgi:hypothetical protein